MKQALLFSICIICGINYSVAQQPMSCSIDGKIVSVLKTFEKDTSSICSKYPCIAKVKIIQVSDCGSSVSHTLHTNDIVEIRFEFTLRNTAKIIPGMKAHYPGLKKGDTFTARVEERLKMRSKNELVIYGYSKIKNAPPK